MGNWSNLPGLVPVYAPGVVAFAVALAGMLASRRFEGRWAAVGAAAVLLGWMLLVPTPRSWAVPRALVEHLVVPAVVVLLGAVAASWVRGRWAGWVGFAVLAVSAWWLAGAPGVRSEFWRVWFAVAGVAGAVRLLRGRSAKGVAVIGLVLLGGSVAAGTPALWSGVAAVLLGAGLGVAAVRPEAALGSVGVAVAVVGMDLGTGGLLRGRVATMDLVCGLAMLAPVAGRWGETRLRRLGRGAPWAAAACVATVFVGAAVAGARLLSR